MAWMMGLSPEDLEIYPLLPRDIAKGNENSVRIVDAFFDAGPNWEEYIRNKAYDETGSSKADAQHFVPKYPNDPTKTSGSYEFREFDFLKTPASELTPEMKTEMYGKAFLTPLTKDTSWMSKVKNERKNTMKITKRQLRNIIRESLEQFYFSEGYSVRKQNCTRSDGKKGKYVLKYKPKKKTSKKKDSQGYVKAGCHTSKEKAHGQRAAIEGG